MSIEIVSGSKAKAQKNTTAVAKYEPKITYMQKVIKGDTWLVMAHSAVQLEDEFANLYYTAQNQSNIFLQPPFDPLVLKQLVVSNNVLNQCVETMEVNVDGTGFDLIPSAEAQLILDRKKEDRKKQQEQDAYEKKLDLHKQATKPPEIDEATGQPKPQTITPPPPAEPEEPLGDGIDEDERDLATAFFNEPYPGLSFVTMRRKLRREMESVGYAYLEVLRNMADEVVGLRNIETHNVRMVKLDTPVLVKKTLMRDGKEVELQIWERERRFAQRVALKQLVYYREFGTSRQVNRNNGHWETPDTPISPEDRGTELLVFGVHPDIQTPYFIPRWINQLPSVVGSRKAEELNLEFLDSGGMPPAIIFVQGGTLAKDASDQLRLYLSGQNKNKHRAVVVEAQSSSGSLESAGSVNVKVERFGSERAMDAMFVKYDAATEDRVRIGFRIPPLFIGKAADYNFATAQTSYMVAEEQVFQPERNEFDERINMTIVKALGLKTIKLKSKPITITAISDQLSGLTLLKDKITPESLVKQVNKLTDIDTDVADQPQPDSVSATFGGAAGGAGTPGGQPAGQPAGPGNGPQGGNRDGGLLENGAKQMAGGKPVPPKPAPQKTTITIQHPNNSQADTVGALPKKKTALDLVNLASDYATVKGLTKKRELPDGTRERVMAEVESLSPLEQQAFNTLIATLTFGSNDPDLVHIAGHAHVH